jgi:hypothetical protein
VPPYCGAAPQIERFPLACRAAAVTLLSAQLEWAKWSVRLPGDCLDFVVADASIDWTASPWTDLNLQAVAREFSNLFQYKIV